MNRASLTSPKLLAAAFFARVVVHASRPETAHNVAKHLEAILRGGLDAAAKPSAADLVALSFYEAADDLELGAEGLFAEDVKREVAIAEIWVRDGWDGTPRDLVARAAVASLTLQEAASRPP